MGKKETMVQLAARNTELEITLQDIVDCDFASLNF